MSPVLLERMCIPLPPVKRFTLFWSHQWSCQPLWPALLWQNICANGAGGFLVASQAKNPIDSYYFYSIFSNCSSINISYIVICLWTTAIVLKRLFLSIFFSFLAAFGGEDLPNSSLSHHQRFIWGYDILNSKWESLKAALP